MQCLIDPCIIQEVVRPAYKVAGVVRMQDNRRNSRTLPKLSPRGYSGHPEINRSESGARAMTTTPLQQHSDPYIENTTDFPRARSGTEQFNRSSGGTVERGLSQHRRYGAASGVPVEIRQNYVHDNAQLFATMSKNFARFGQVLANTQPEQLARQGHERPPLSKILRQAAHSQKFQSQERRPDAAQPQLAFSKQHPNMARLDRSAVAASFSKAGGEFPEFHQTTFALSASPLRVDSLDAEADSLTPARTDILAHDHSAEPSRADGRRRWQAWEDDVVREMVAKQGPHSWNKIADKLTHRSANQIRLRWRQSLDPDLRKVPFTRGEDEQILREQALLGNKWKHIAESIGTSRSYNEIKNRWHILQKKKVRHSAESSLQRRDRDMHDASQESSDENEDSQNETTSEPEPL